MYIYIPKELVNIILEYDGRIKYIKGRYENIIPKYDFRYNLIRPIINKKIQPLEEKGGFFYFDIEFNPNTNMGLCYAWDYNNNNNNGKSIQILVSFYNFQKFEINRTYI